MFHFVCILLFLNICNTVMMTWCHVEMSAVLFLYVCVQASKEIIKLKNLCMHTFLCQGSSKKLCFLWLSPLPPPPPPSCIFHRKCWFRKHTPTVLSPFSPLSPPPSRAQPRSPFSPFVIHLASSFHCRDKRAQCIVGRLSLKKGPLPCVCCGRASFMLHSHTQKMSDTNSPLVLPLDHGRAAIRLAAQKPAFMPVPPNYLWGGEENVPWYFFVIFFCCACVKYVHSTLPVMVHERAPDNWWVKLLNHLTSCRPGVKKL